MPKSLTLNNSFSPQSYSWGFSPPGSPNSLNTSPYTSPATTPIHSDPDEDQIDNIKTLPDTPLRSLRATEAREFYDSFLGNTYGACSSSDSVEEYCELFDTITEKSPSTCNKLEALAEIYDECKYKPENHTRRESVYNFKHILSVDKKGGCHYVQSDPTNGITFKNIIESTQGPYQATIFVKNDELKNSTIFPEKLIPNQSLLLETIRQTTFVVKNENRILWMTQHKFAMEATYRSNFVIGTSAYPIFYFDVYAPDKTYEIVENRYQFTAETLLTQARTHYQSTYDNKLIKYTVRDPKPTSLIVDVAPLIQIGVAKGIYIQFPKTLLKQH